MDHSLLSQTIIERALKQFPLGNIEYHPTITSTNDRAAELITNNAPDLTLVIADEQTKGKGRSGRKWFTPKNSALAFSIIIHPQPNLSLSHASRFSGLGALAVTHTLQKKYSMNSKIKWPNDILMNGKKVSGILTESQWLNDQLKAVIIGIGINIAHKSVPPLEELNFPATSVEAELGNKVDRLEFLTAVIDNLLYWKDHQEQSIFINEWDSQLAYKGEQVKIFSTPENQIQGELIGLDKNGGIILKEPNLGEVAIQTGEIHLRPLVDSDIN